MSLFTGRRYLGLGKPLDHGESVDEEDLIVLSHNHSHDKYEADEDVFAADKDDFHNFVSDWASGRSWHSLDSAAGIGLKNLVKEKILGHTLYERRHLSGPKRDYKECAVSRQDSGALRKSSVQLHRRRPALGTTMCRQLHWRGSGAVGSRA